MEPSGASAKSHHVVSSVSEGLPAGNVATLRRPTFETMRSIERKERFKVPRQRRKRILKVTRRSPRCLVNEASQPLAVLTYRPYDILSREMALRIAGVCGTSGFRAETFLGRS